MTPQPRNRIPPRRPQEHALARNRQPRPTIPAPTRRLTRIMPARRVVAGARKAGTGRQPIPTTGSHARTAPRSPRSADGTAAKADGSQDAAHEPRPGSKSTAGWQQAPDPPGAARHSNRSNRPAPHSATPQPPSASSTRSDRYGLAQDARGSRQPMSTARDNETAPEPHAAEDGPILPRSQPKPAAAQKTVPKTALISTRPPPGQPHPTRVDGGYHDPRDAAPEDGGYHDPRDAEPEGRIRPSPEKLAKQRNAPQCPSGGLEPSRQSRRSQSATDACERLHSGCAEKQLPDLRQPRAANSTSWNIPIHARPALTTTAGEFSTRRPRVQNQAMDIPKPLTGRKKSCLRFCRRARDAPSSPTILETTSDFRTSMASFVQSN